VAYRPRKVTRLAASTHPASIPDSQTNSRGLDGGTTRDTMVRRLDAPAGPVSNPDGRTAGALTAPPTAADGGIQARLRAAYAQERPEGGPWTARTLAQAAGCGRSTAAAFLRRHREDTGEPAP
jgi:hypothetical protein